MQSTEVYYRRSAAQGASGFGLLIALYDTLAGDLRRAAEAERRNDLEKRCSEVNHALVLIGYLEDCLEKAGGGELASQLVTLYSDIRRGLIVAQVKRSPEILEMQMALILRLRESWQTMELSSIHPPLLPSDPAAHGDVGHLQLAPRSSGASWSA